MDLMPAFVTRLPQHELGQAAVNSLRKYGVDTSRIVRGGERIGIYYLEKEHRKDRPKSSMTVPVQHSILPSKKNLTGKKILEGAEWFHFTGITPALNDEVAAICLEACKTAKKMGCEDFL